MNKNLRQIVRERLRKAFAADELQSQHIATKGR